MKTNYNFMLVRIFLFEKNNCILSKAYSAEIIQVEKMFKNSSENYNIKIKIIYNTKIRNNIYHIILYSIT